MANNKVEIQVPRKHERTLAMAAVKGRTQQSGGNAVAKVPNKSLLRLASRLPNDTIVYVDGVKCRVADNAFAIA